MTWRCAAWIVCLLWIAAALGAEETGPQVVRLALHPSPPASPALKHRLLPGIWERQPGNRAPFYYRALLLSRTPADAERAKLEVEHGEGWFAATLTDDSRQSLRKWVEMFPRTAYGELKTAAYRERCDFELRVQDLQGTEIIAVLLPEIQEMRQLGRHLRGKARLEIDARDFAAANESLRLGYQLGRDTAGDPLLINGLVGIAICSLMNAEVEQWIGSPDSPNLYWALAALPQPLVDLRPAVEFEVRLPQRIFPAFDDAETVTRTPQEWQRLYQDALRAMQSDLMGNSAPAMAGVWNDLAVSALLLRSYPQAKSELAKQGFAAEKLNKMPVGQVVAIYTKRTLDFISDEYAKGLYVPASERQAFYDELEERLKREGYLGHPGKEALPLASLLMPAVHAAFRAQTRLERDVAALQTLEAIRAHLAATGKLPHQLGEITVVRVPKNPATGEWFPYKQEGKTAVLESPPTPPTLSPSMGKRYELSIAERVE